MERKSSELVCFICAKKYKSEINALEIPEALKKQIITGMASCKDKPRSGYLKLVINWDLGSGSIIDADINEVPTNKLLENEEY